MTDQKSVDEKWQLWSRNVRDQFKDLPTEEIKRQLKETALPCAVLMSQIQGDFNFSNVIRTANFFNLQAVYYYGKKHYDRRGTTGCHLYSDVQYLSSFDQIKALKDRYTFVGLENNVSRPTIDINQFHFSSNTLLLVGEENMGLSDEVLGLCDYLVEIPAAGSVRSLNAATAVAIAVSLMSAQLRS